LQDIDLVALPGPADTAELSAAIEEPDQADGIRPMLALAAA